MNKKIIIKKNIKTLIKLWNEISPIKYLLTLKIYNGKMEKEFFKSMFILGIVRDENFFVIESEKAEPRYQQDDIFKTHWKVTNHANKNFKNKSIVIFEDDCRLIPCSNKRKIDHYIKCQKRLIRSFKYILSLPPHMWGVFNIGQVSILGILIKIPKEPLVYTSKPYGAQSYILNGYYINSLLSQIPKEEWKAKKVVEEFNVFDITKKFAIYPNITCQCIVPKEVHNIIKFIPSHITFSITNTLTLLKPYIFIIIIILTIISLCLYKRFI